MQRYYSKTTGSTYLTGIQSNMPGDAVPITEDRYQKVIADPPFGKIRSHDAEGLPILIDPPAATAEQIWPQIKAERDRRKSLGVQANGNWFHSDTDSRIQQLALTIMGQTMPAGIQWKTMSGTFVEMTPTLAGQIFAATAALDQAIFSAAETHRVAMEASAVPGDYDFSGGWPAIFEE